MANLINKPQSRSPEPEKTSPVGEQVTYIPGEDDPPTTKWHGLVFHGNIPKTVTNQHLIEQARNNRFFKVGTFEAAKDSKAATAAEPVPDPKTSGEYRAHFVGWFKKVDNINVLVERWSKEQPMRDACEVGADDYSYIGTLFHPKMHELTKASGLNQQQLTELWARYGVFQLPF